MKDNKMKLKARIEQLERKNKELLYSTVVCHNIAYNSIDKYSVDRLSGSAVMIDLAFLGDSVVNTVVISDGLSSDTIECLKRDILRSQHHDQDFMIKNKEG